MLIRDTLSTPKLTTFLMGPCLILTGRQRNPLPLLRLSAIRSVVILRLDELGDMVMMTPFLRELRRNLPGASITLVVKPVLLPLMECCPYIDECLSFVDLNLNLTPSGRARRHWNALSFALKHLWKTRFDLAILPRRDVDNSYAAFLAYFSGTTHRVGYSEQVCSEKQIANRDYDLLLTRPFFQDGLKHEVEVNLDILRMLGGSVQNDALELWTDRDDERFVEDLFAHHHIQPTDLVIGVCPSGGHSPLKQWPLERVIEIVRWIRSTYKARILLFGSDDEQELGAAILREEPTVINVIGQTTLRQMAATLQRCRLFIGNDTGVLHVAAAAGCRVVALFGPSCHHRFRPWTTELELITLERPCSPCTRRNHYHRCDECLCGQPYCMTEITVAQVQQCIRTVLRR